MSPAKPLVIDWKADANTANLFQNPPILSSKQATWDCVYLEYHHQPANEVSEHCFAQHVISIHCERPITIEQVENGCLQREHLVHGDISFYPAGHCLSARWDQPTKFIDLYLEPALLENAAAEIGDSTRVELIPQLKVKDPLIHHLGLAMLADLQFNRLGSRLYAESIAVTLSMHLLREYAIRKRTISDYKAGLPAHKLQQVLDYIHAHLDRELFLAELAQAVQMSRYYFSRLFKQSTGLTPHQYLIHCRVEQAKQLLLQSQLSIAEIAYSVGFANQSHLNRHFKRLLGITPAALLNKSQSRTK